MTKLTNSVPLDRRQFLQHSGALVAAGALVHSVVLAADTAAPNAAALVAGKDPRLTILTPQPAVFETPLDLLRDGITPVELLFVRNNQQPLGTATIKPTPLGDWKIELAGLVDRPQSFAAAKLADLEQVEHEMVLQCSGNSRSLFARSAPVKGVQWQHGGMGNVRLAGVRLKTLLDQLGVRIAPEAKFLAAEGSDEPAAAGESDFEHSIPLADALARSIVALRLNGQPLPAIHGGPVRLVTPGYFGTMHVKWLSRLRFETRESDHVSQIPNYRTPREPIAPGSAFTPTYENSEPNWRMPIKSVIFSPARGAKLPAGDATVRGVAFNDGRARIDQLLVSVDAGRTWQQAKLDVPTSPYAWYPWQAQVQLARGQHEIWATAVDALGRTQPGDGSIGWNPQGYAWNGMEKVEVFVA